MSRKVGLRKLGQCPYNTCTSGNLMVSSAGSPRKYGQQLMICSCGSYSVRKDNGFVYPLIDADDPDAEVVVAVPER